MPKKEKDAPAENWNGPLRVFKKGDLSHSFRIDLECEVDAFEYDRNFIVRLKLKEGPNGDTPGSKAGLMHGITSIFQFPAENFPTQKARIEWVDTVVDRFKRSLVEVLTDEARLRFNDVGNYFLARMGFDPEPATEKFILESHLRATKDRIRGYLGAGLNPQWTKDELEQAIKGAFATLKRGRHTYEGVLSALQESHPHKAPPSVPALKQLVIRKEIDWKMLKSNAAPTVVTFPKSNIAGRGVTKKAQREKKYGPKK